MAISGKIIEHAQLVKIKATVENSKGKESDFVAAIAASTALYKHTSQEMMRGNGGRRW